MNGDRWRTGLRRIGQVLFSARVAGCVVCHAPASTSNPLGLCAACYGKIPWIRQVVCQVCGRAEPCGDCQRRGERYLSMNRSAVRYDDTMKEWLALYKYRGNEKLEPLFGHMLLHAYRLFPADVNFDLVTFVPISGERLAERGFNQAERMARRLAGTLRLPVVPLIDRVKHTEKQSFKSRRERLENLSEAFVPASRGTEVLMERYRKRDTIRVLLVDDVYTTGTTLNQCAAVIHRIVPAEVYGLCWAR